MVNFVHFRNTKYTNYHAPWERPIWPPHVNCDCDQASISARLQGGMRYLVYMRYLWLPHTQTGDDIKCIQSRAITAGDEDYPSDTLHIFAENAPLDEYNVTRLEQIQSPQYKLKAFDQIPPHVRKQDMERVLSKRRSETGGLDTEIVIKENARVMLTTNVDITDRLINGQLGTVVKVNVDNVSNKPSSYYLCQV